MAGLKKTSRRWEIVFCLPTTDVFVRAVGVEVVGIRSVSFFEKTNPRIRIAEHPVDFLERASKWSNEEKTSRRFSAGIIKSL